MRLGRLWQDKTLQSVLGLAIGTAFGFLLEKGGVTRYDVILGQLLLSDFTVLKMMFSAVLVGMVGVHAMRAAGLVRLHVREGSLGATVAGGLIFGIGFAVLGYCPGTAAAASGSGALDAVVGMAGIVVGAGIFARLYPLLEGKVLGFGKFHATTIPELLGVPPGRVAAVFSVLIAALLAVLAASGI